MEEPEILCVTSLEVGKRLDALLAYLFPGYSRSYFQYLIDEGGVLLNGQRTKKRTKPKLNDEIEICFFLPPEIDLKPEAIPLEILYEDDHLLAISKPAGMVVHPAPGNHSKTFVNALLHHCKELPVYNDSLRPGIVHRLDKETTGVLLAAKTSHMHNELVSLFCERAIQKKYLAVCVGNPGDQTICAPISRHPRKRKEMCVDEKRGKEALTQTKVIANKGNFSLVEVAPITGRTHQIRVHMKHAGCPILGDPTYGPINLNKKFQLKRQLLHAQTISFTHPQTQKSLTISAPLPEEMCTVLNKIGLA